MSNVAIECHSENPGTIRVLHILNELRPSGAEMMLVSGSAEFRRLGVTTSVLSLGGVVGPYADFMRQAGYRILHIRFNKTLGFLSELRRLFKDDSYDAVHIHCERGSFWISLIAKLSSRATIVRTVHNVFPFGGVLRLRRKLQRKISSSIGVRFSAVSESVRKNELTRFGIKAQHIPNWYDNNRFFPPSAKQKKEARDALNIPQDTAVIVSVGNCNEAKNHSMLLRALNGVEGVSFLYLHVGHEDRDCTERKLAQEMGLESKVRFLGARSDIPVILHAADAYVMPSLYEGMSIAALEALGSGLPALFTEVPGLSDFKGLVQGIVYCSPTETSIREGMYRLFNRLKDETGACREDRASKVASLWGISSSIACYVRLYGR